MKMADIIEEVTKVASNALYFDDSSDYRTALWEILAIINPVKYSDVDEISEYID
jgi:hypothetical protein